MFLETDLVAMRVDIVKCTWNNSPAVNNLPRKYTDRFVRSSVTSDLAGCYNVGKITIFGAQRRRESDNIRMARVQVKLSEYITFILYH